MARKTKTKEPATADTTPPPATTLLVETARCDVWAGNSRMPTEEGLAELADSIRANGILQPLLGRRKAEGRIEIICGARRLAAAREAGLEFAPVYLVDLSDKEAAAAVAAENLIREDFCPLDAADAVEATLKAYGSPQAAADALARPVGWVRRVASLTGLHGSFYSIARDQNLSLGFLSEVARLPEHIQENILACNRHTLLSIPGGNLTALRGLVRQFTAAIGECAWLRNDPACPMCACRTDAEPDLFPEYDSAAPSCTNIQCREEKREAFVSRQRVAAAAKASLPLAEVKTADWGKGTDKPKKSASHTVPVVIGQGPDSGKIVWREPEAAKTGADATPKGPSPQARLAAKFIRQVEGLVKDDATLLGWAGRAHAGELMALAFITGVGDIAGGHTAAHINGDYLALQDGSADSAEAMADALRPRLLAKFRFAQVGDCDEAYQWAVFAADLLALPIDAPLKGEVI